MRSVWAALSPTSAFTRKQKSYPTPRSARYCVAMSQENVEIALAAADAWNRGDREAFLALWDEEAEFFPLRAQLEGESYLGHDGLMRFMAESDQDFEDVRFEIEETRDVGEQALGIGRFRARGRASGIDINVPLGVLMRVRSGKIVYARLFTEPRDALEAAGLRE
jgi:ketosteroid isomerase-like protein